MKKFPSFPGVTAFGGARRADRAAKEPARNAYGLAKTSPSIGIVLLVIAVLIVSVFSGMLIGAGQKTLLMPIIGAAAGVILLMLPLEWMFILLMGMSFIFVGVLQFFANINYVNWLPFMLAGFLYFYFLVKLFEIHKADRVSLSAMFLWLGLSLFLAALTSLYNGISVLQWLAAGKDYFAFWSVLLIMAFLPIREKSVELIWKLLFVVALVQLPVVLYQYIVIGGNRIESGLGDSWDVVVGTFGGSQEGGGQSAALGFFQVVMVVFALSLWRRAQITKKLLFLIVAVAVVTIYVAEVKAMLFLMPVAFLMLYRRDLLRRPREMVIGLLLIAGFMSIMPMAYNTLHYEREGRRATTSTEFVESILSASSDPDFIVGSTGQMGRLTQLIFWSEQHGSGKTYEFLFGHGIGSTHISRLYVGEVARRYFPLRPGTSSLAILLWEVGVLGLTFLVLALLAGARLAARLAKNENVPVVHRAILETSAIGLALVVLTFPYKQYAIQGPAIQLLIVLMLGQVAYWNSRVRKA